MKGRPIRCQLCRLDFLAGSNGPWQYQNTLCRSLPSLSGAPDYTVARGEYLLRIFLGSVNEAKRHLTFDAKTTIDTVEGQKRDSVLQTPFIADSGKSGLEFDRFSQS
jgi:hypothetical protein